MPEPTAGELGCLQELYDRGRFLEAHQRGSAIAPLETWSGTEARVLAGRILGSVGQRRAADALHFLAFRQSPKHAKAFFYAGGTWLHRFGPLIAWEFLDRHETAVTVQTAEDRSDVHSLRGLAAGGLRDFVTAERHLALAEEAESEKPWLYVVRSTLRAEQSEHPEALRLAQEALRVRSWYPPAVHTVAEQLTFLGRLDEACAFLEEAAEHVQSPHVAQALVFLYREAGRYPAALQALQTAWNMSPRPDRDLRNWFHSVRADLLYRMGRYGESAESSGKMEFRPRDTEAQTYFREFSQRILAPGFDRKRQLIAVPFIHQQYDTCAPTTIAMLCGYWGKPVDHRDVAQEICYGGTPGFRQRQWAESNGWLTREFTLTEQVSAELLARDIPFAIATVDPGAGHIMAVVGYDTGRQAVLVRDPRQPFIAEYRLAETLKHYAAFGPSCLLILPPEKAGLLEGIELPDSALHDLAYRLNCALDRHDRGAAAAALEQLQRDAPGHRITLHAGMLLARYDCDPLASLRSIEALLAAYPDSLVLKLIKNQCLRDMERPAARREYLEELAVAETTHPLVWAQLAGELSSDARHRRRSRSLLRRSLRACPGEAQSHLMLGGLYWDEGRYAQACQAYRFALCLAEKDEQMVHAYFTACRHVKRTDEALAYLRDRFERFGRKSAGPVMSLFAANAMQGQAEEGLEAIEEGVRRRPDDGEMLLYAAMRMSEFGRMPRAGELLEQAQPRSAPSRHLRAAAFVAMCRLDLPRAAELWRQVVQRDPFDAEALAHAARLVGQTQSPQAAADFLEGLAARFPFNQALQRLLYAWVPEEQGPRRLKLLEDLLKHDPDNLWALHRKALLLLDLQRTADARAVAEAAQPLAPELADQHWIMGAVLEAAGQLADARQACARSLAARVDFEPAIDLLMRCSITQEEREQSLAVVEREMIRQTIYGDGLLSYWNHARSVLEPERLLASLRQALEARPDLWHAHAAVIRQHLQLGQSPAARAAAEKAVERFPLVPALWLELAQVYRAEGQQEAELVSLQKALEVSPGWWEAIEMLLGVHKRNNDLPSAEQTAARAVQCDPLRSEPRVALAEIHLIRGRGEEAIEGIKQALELEPHNDHAWSCLGRWAEQFQQPEVPVQLARQLVQRRPGEPAVHYRLASLLTGAESLDERIRGLNRALELLPRYTEAYELRAELLAEHGRFDEAHESLKTDAWGRRVPSPLRLCAATLYLMQGYLAQAVSVVEDVLKTEPRSIPAWLKLAQCHEAGQDAARYLDAHQRAFEINPRSVVLAAMLANAHLVNGHRREARELLEKAAYLAPTYLYAWLTLLDVLLEEEDLPAIERLIESLRTHFAREYALSAEIQLAVARKDKDAAFAAVGRLLAVPHPDEGVFRPSLGSIFAHSPWAADLENVLLTASRQAEAHPATGELWVRWYAPKADFRTCLEVLDGIAGATERKRRALVAYCQVYVQQDATGNRSQKIVNRYREILQSSTEAWAWAGRILNFDHQPEEVIHWMHDWRQRKPAAAWMLRPLATSLFEQNRLPESAEVSRIALRLAPDESVPMHQTIVAWLEVQSPNGARPAADRLRGLVTHAMWPIYQLLHDCTKCVAEAQVVAPHECRAAALRGRKQLNGIWKSWKYPGDELAKRILGETRRLLNRHLTWWDRLAARQAEAGIVAAVVVAAVIVSVLLVMANSRPGPARSNYPPAPTRGGPAQPYYPPPQPVVPPYPQPMPGQPSFDPSRGRTWNPPQPPQPMPGQPSFDPSRGRTWNPPQAPQPWQSNPRSPAAPGWGPAQPPARPGSPPFSPSPGRFGR